MNLRLVQPMRFTMPKSSGLVIEIARSKNALNCEMNILKESRMERLEVLRRIEESLQSSTSLVI